MTVLITDGHSRLELIKMGDADQDYPASDYFTQISINSGQFTATVQAYARNLSHFVSSISRLHEALSGEAKLEFWMEEHSVVLSGNGKGQIKLEATITDGLNPPSARLELVLLFDQSYLPGWVSDMKVEFPF